MKKVVIAIIVLAVLIGGGYLIFHKSPSTTPASSSTGSTTSNSTTPASSAAIIKTATNSAVGQYLTDGNNMALYTYGADTSGVSNCSGSCLYSWPIYGPTSSSSASLPANVTVIKRSDGSSQYAYKGMPLYNFSSDSAGKVTGDGLSNFHVAKP